VFARTARLLREAGIASQRIDFRDSGESDGAFEFTTFDRQVADGLAALGWLAAEPRVQGDRVAIIGWSQGGLVAAGVAGRSGAPAAVALWAAVADPEPTVAGLLGADAIDCGLAPPEGEALRVTLPWGGRHRPAARCLRRRAQP
jgi:alpha/beta superfamily hydrolase